VTDQRELSDVGVHWRARRAAIANMMNQRSNQRARKRCGTFGRGGVAALLAMTAATAGAPWAWAQAGVAATQPAMQWPPAGGAGAATGPTDGEPGAPGKITALPPSTQVGELAISTQPSAGATTAPVAGGLMGMGGASTQPIKPTVMAATAPATSEPALVAAPYPTDPAQQEADAALAERLCQIAQLSLPEKSPSSAMWDPIIKQLAAMLAGSSKLAPRDARLARLTADAMQRAGDYQGTLDALKAAHTAEPADQFTTLRIIEQYASKMETAAEKLSYYKQILGTVQQPNAIRARAGVEAAQLLYDRGQPDAADKTLSEALRLNAVDPSGLRLRYQMLSPTASAYERAVALMALLKANPAQPAYTAALADQLGQAGLAAEAVPWYRLTLSLTTFSGSTDLNAARNAIVEMLLSDQSPDAGNLADRLVKIQPSLAVNWFLKLAVMQGNGNADDYQAALQQARTAITNTLVMRVNALAGASSGAGAGDKPTTRPISDPGPYPPPNLALTVAQLNQSGKAADKASFVSATYDLALLELLFAQQPTIAAPLLDAMSAVLPANDPQLALLQGWSAVESGQAEEARARLTPLAKENPLAQLGLIRLMTAQQHDAAATAARVLLSANPSGTVAAILSNQLRTLDAHIVLSSQSQTLAEAADSFPTTWLRVLEQPQSFYAIHVEPLYVACDYGQPMLARVTIQNLTTNDLTIGPDGVLQRGMVFGAQVRGLEDKNFASAAYEELAGPLVLAERASMSQVVRVDQFALAQYLDANPDEAMAVYATAETNPGPGPGGVAVPGPGGYQVQFLKVFSRLAEPIGSVIYQRALTNLEEGSTATGRQKIADLDLLARQVELLNAHPNGERVAGIQLEHLHRARSDALPAVAAWAGYLSSMVAEPGQRRDLLRDMAGNSDWRQREMALVGAASLKPVEALALARKLAEDPEPSVRALAGARVGLAEVEVKGAGAASASQPAAMQGVQ
jgi:hypothetical protein